MDFYGVNNKGRTGIPVFTTLPSFTSNDIRKIILVEDENAFYYGGQTDWNKLVINNYPFSTNHSNGQLNISDSYYIPGDGLHTVTSNTITLTAASIDGYTKTDIENVLPGLKMVLGRQIDGYGNESNIIDKGGTITQITTTNKGDFIINYELVIHIL